MKTTVNWKKWNDSGALGPVSKTHILSDDVAGVTICGTKIPSSYRDRAEVEYFEIGSPCCKRCRKAA